MFGWEGFVEIYVQVGGEIQRGVGLGGGVMFDLVIKYSQQVRYF